MRDLQSAINRELYQAERDLRGSQIEMAIRTAGIMLHSMAALASCLDACWKVSSTQDI